jgi:hypothetical protein
LVSECELTVVLLCLWSKINNFNHLTTENLYDEVSLNCSVYNVSIGFIHCILQTNKLLGSKVINVSYNNKTVILKRPVLLVEEMRNTRMKQAIVWYDCVVRLFGTTVWYDMWYDCVVRRVVRLWYDVWYDCVVRRVVRLCGTTVWYDVWYDCVVRLCFSFDYF